MPLSIRSCREDLRDDIITRIRDVKVNTHVKRLILIQDSRLVRYFAEPVQCNADSQNPCTHAAKAERPHLRFALRPLAVTPLRHTIKAVFSFHRPIRCRLIQQQSSEAQIRAVGIEEARCAAHKVQELTQHLY